MGLPFVNFIKFHFKGLTPHNSIRFSGLLLSGLVEYRSTWLACGTVNPFQQSWPVIVFMFCISRLRGTGSYRLACPCDALSY